MTQENKDILLKLLEQHKELGISKQIDYEKFYLYSIITHSTAIEGSTVTEVEAIQALIDTREGEDIEIFLNCMSRMHCQHLKYDIDQYMKSVDSEIDSTTQKIQITTQKTTGTTQKTPNTTQKEILNYLKEHPHATRKDMAVAIGNITEDGIKFNIGKLQQYGLLKREGGRKSGTWVVIDNDN